MQKAVSGAITMADADDVRRLALALPHVVEIDSDGFDFRVGGKGFVWSYPERRPGERKPIHRSSMSAHDEGMADVEQVWARIQAHAD
ncbi:hypothetical protein [Actinoallomurus sp. NPDC052274]|uniref:hypothetical protein n=1 Tax=Actinoallomurus sp. NPDC052274 TaxID=3155420 RepID=UPI0034175A5E